MTVWDTIAEWWTTVWEDETVFPFLVAALCIGGVGVMALFCYILRPVRAIRRAWRKLCGVSEPESMFGRDAKDPRAAPQHPAQMSSGNVNGSGHVDSDVEGSSRVVVVHPRATTVQDRNGAMNPSHSKQMLVRPPSTAVLVHRASTPPVRPGTPGTAPTTPCPKPSLGSALVSFQASRRARRLVSLPQLLPVSTNAASGSTAGDSGRCTPGSGSTPGDNVGSNNAGNQQKPTTTSKRKLNRPPPLLLPAAPPSKPPPPQLAGQGSPATGAPRVAGALPAHLRASPGVDTPGTVISVLDFPASPYGSPVLTALKADALSSSAGSSIPPAKRATWVADQESGRGLQRSADPAAGVGGRGDSVGDEQGNDGGGEASQVGGQTAGALPPDTSSDRQLAESLQQAEIAGATPGGYAAATALPATALPEHLQRWARLRALHQQQMLVLAAQQQQQLLVAAAYGWTPSMMQPVFMQQSQALAVQQESERTSLVAATQIEYAVHKAHSSHDVTSGVVHGSVGVKAHVAAAHTPVAPTKPPPPAGRSSRSRRRRRDNRDTGDMFTHGTPAGWRSVASGASPTPAFVFPPSGTTPVAPSPTQAAPRSSPPRLQPLPGKRRIGPSNFSGASAGRRRKLIAALPGASVRSPELIAPASPLPPRFHK